MKLKKNHIYRFKYKNDTPLCIYLCNTQSKDRILVIPLTESSDGNVHKLSVTKQYASLDNYLEINTDNIISPLYLKSGQVTVPYSDLETIHKHILSNLMNKISSDVHTTNTSNMLFESLYQFLKWKQKKISLNYTAYSRKTNVYENGIYWAALGVNIGSELNKSRPVLVWKKRCNGDNEESYSYIVIPITSKEKSKKYYMNVPININGRECFLRTEDMRRISIKRFTRPILDHNNNIIFIDEEKRKEIIAAIEKFFIFENRHKTS